MIKAVIHRIDRTPFEAPLAGLLGAAAAFAVFAMPADLFGALPAAPLIPGGKAIIAAVAAVILGGIGYFGMKLAGSAAIPSIWEQDLDAAEEDEPEADEPAVRMRRADRHPDAPARQPIRASRDLGEPFMEVGAKPAAEEESYGADRFVPWHPEAQPVEAEAEAAHEDPIAEVEPAAEAHDEPAAEAAPEVPEAPEAPAAPAEAPHQDVTAREGMTAPEETAAHHEEAVAREDDSADEVPSPIAAFAPADEPAPQPVRAGRQSISTLMERLSAGVDRRGGEAPTRFSADEVADTYGRPRAGSEDLRKALDELNRLAARRD